MKHIKLITAEIKALDWGLNSGGTVIVTLIQAIVSFITALMNIKNPQANSQSG